MIDLLTIEIWKITAEEVCDILITIVIEHFVNKNHLNDSHLFLTINFPTYENYFLSDHLNKTVDAFLDVTNLKIELQPFYNSTDFRLQWLIYWNL